MKLNKNKKGSAVIYIVTIFAMITIIFIAAIVAPIGIRFTVDAYTAGENIMLSANQSISNIQDEAVKQSVRDTVQLAMDAQVNNIEVNSNIFQYSWVIIIIIVGLVAFIQARRLVEYGGGMI